MFLQVDEGTFLFFFFFFWPPPQIPRHTFLATFCFSIFFFFFFLIKFLQVRPEVCPL